MHGRGECMAWGMHGGVNGRGCMQQRGMHGRVAGVCISGGVVAGEMATAADGSHPTGMHPCS